MENQPQEVSASSLVSQRETIALNAGKGGILGIKAGMTQIHGEQGQVLAVTVIDLKPSIITQVKTLEKNGYVSVQVGFLKKKSRSANRADLGRLKKIQPELDHSFYHYQEFRLPENAVLEGIVPGKILSPDFVKVGEYVDLSGVNKGKGYQGGVKRYHMAGGYKSHGASLSHRQLGSIGNRADPGKCFKNKKMAGQMGNVRVTVQNVQVVGIDSENQLLLVHGSVPGPKGGIVTIRRTVKNVEQL